MGSIKVEHSPKDVLLQELKVKQWPIWTKEESEFPWSYDESETCYLLEGEVEVIPKGEKPVKIQKGDLVTFPRGMECTWIVRKAVRKHYRFGD